MTAQREDRQTERKPNPPRSKDRARAERVLRAKRSTPAQRLEALKLIVELIETEDKKKQTQAGGSNPTRYGHIQRGAEYMDKAFSYEITERVAVLSQSGETSKELNLVSYNGSQPKYDLRSWRRTGGEERLLKGLTLSQDEAKALKQALNARGEL